MVSRREFVIAIGVGTIAAPSMSFGQTPGKVYRIGFFSAGPPFAPEVRAVFPQALRELGWIEGKNIMLETRFAEDRPERLSELASELVRLNVDVIATVGTLAPLAAKRATATIPIVLTAAGDPLGSGLVASLARPGGNVTGLSMMVPELAGKRLQLLREVLPKLSRVGVIWNAANPYPALVFRETQDAARKMGIEIQSLEIRSQGDFQHATEAAKRTRVNALITVEDPLTGGLRTQIVDFAAKSRLPAIYGLTEFVNAGGLMSYGISLIDLLRRSAGYVDRILKGANPADLPVEQPTTFDFVINRKTAKALGLTIPQELLMRADRVIE